MRKKRIRHNWNRIVVCLFLSVLIMPGIKSFVAVAEGNQAGEISTGSEPSSPEKQQPQTGASSATATIGNISRTVSLKVAPGENIMYNDWAGTGAAQTEEGLKSTGALVGSGTADNPQKVGKSGALVWLMVKASVGDLSKDYQNVLLTADISLRGNGFGGSTDVSLE